MPVLRAAAAAAVVALLVAGCSDDTPAPVVAPAPPPSAAATAPAAVTLPLLAAFAQQDPGVVAVQVDQCADVVRYAVDESDEQVEVTLTADAIETCVDGPRNVVVPLAAPLGDRAVVDGATGQAVTVAVGDPPGPPVPTVAATPG